MVLTADEGRYPKCPRCFGKIINRESVGIVDDGKNLWHSDCYRDKFGYNSVREDPYERLKRIVNSDKRGTNKFGGRYIR